MSKGSKNRSDSKSFRDNFNNIDFSNRPISLDSSIESAVDAVENLTASRESVMNISGDGHVYDEHGLIAGQGVRLELDCGWTFSGGDSGVYGQHYMGRGSCNFVRFHLFNKSMAETARQIIDAKLLRSESRGGFLV